LAVATMGTQGRYALNYGYIDHSGKFVIDQKYYPPVDFREGLALVSQGDRYGFIDRTDTLVIPAKYWGVGMNDEINEFGEGLARVASGSRSAPKFGYMDKSGILVIEARFDGAAPFSDGLARVEIDGKLSFIDKTGKVAISTGLNLDEDFERNSGDFSEGLAGVSEGMDTTVTDGNYAFVDKSGKIVLRTDFSYAFPFSEGLAAGYVSTRDKWGYIDKTGKMVIPATYDSADSFSEGLAAVGRNELVAPVPSRVPKR
jgi:hypothetical protein